MASCNLQNLILKVLNEAKCFTFELVNSGSPGDFIQIVYMNKEIELW